MFKQRLLTALVLIPLLLIGIYYANQWVIKATAVLALIGCALEWLQLIPFNKKPTQAGFLLLLFLSIIPISEAFNIWLIIGLATWALIFLALIRFPLSQTVWGYSWIVAGSAIILLPLFAQSLVLITQLPQGKGLLISLLFMVWGADTGGYFIGKIWGKHRLIPKVSPGKTIEGSLGGAIFTLIVATISYPYLDFQPHQQLGWFMVAFFVFIMALVGDLFISMLKRRVHIKDTGTLFPGHGGVLDRLDSLIAASPAFYFGLHWLQQGVL